MPESSTFKKNFPTNQAAPMREFNVGPTESAQVSSFGPPPSNSSPPQEAAPLPKMSFASKTRIELLAEIGSLTKDVIIGANTFSIRTLKSKEVRAATLAAFSTSKTELEVSFASRLQQLARAIVKIDGNDFGLTIGSDDLDKKILVIEEFEEFVVNKLYNEFSNLKKEAEETYGIKTVEEAKEVAEDLKK